MQDHRVGAEIGAHLLECCRTVPLAVFPILHLLDDHHALGLDFYPWGDLVEREYHEVREHAFCQSTDGETEHYGPYGSLVIMMWPDAGFDSHAIRGSAASLGHLAELIEVKLATAEPGQPIMIREEYSADSPYSLLLDVRADGFEPAAADREQLGAATEPKKAPEKKS